MAWFGKNKAGKDVCLLTPDEKKKKYQRELKENRKRTNSGKFKLDENKRSITLTAEEKAYRNGYISATIDSGKAYHYNRAKRLKSR